MLLSDKKKTKAKDMKFLLLEYVKQHLRLDTDCEDSLLAMYADAAESTLANYLNRGKTAQEMIDSLTEEYGEIPAPIYQAALELVDASYQHRSPSSPTQMYYVPYGFDALIKPYMNL